MNNSKLKTFRITKFIFTLSILGALLGIAAYVYVFHIINSVGHNNASLQAEITGLNAKESQVDELKKTLADNQAKQPKLQSYFIDANDIVPFLETIEQYGKQTNVGVKFNTVTINQSPDRLVVQLTGDGAFPDMYRFIALVEAAPYEFTIDSSTIQVAAVTTDPVTGKPLPARTWETNMQLSVLSITGVQHTAQSVK